MYWRASSSTMFWGGSPQKSNTCTPDNCHEQQFPGKIIARHWQYQNQRTKDSGSIWSTHEFNLPRHGFNVEHYFVTKRLFPWDRNYQELTNDKSMIHYAKLNKHAQHRLGIQLESGQATPWTFMESWVVRHHLFARNSYCGTGPNSWNSMEFLWIPWTFHESHGIP